MRLGIITVLVLMATAASVFADSAVAFSPEALRQVEKRNGIRALKRIEDFSVTIAGFKGLALYEQLARVNQYVNGYLPEYDAVVNKQEDYWSTPREFLAAGYGDCEEYAITKYYTLKSLGVEDERLCLAIVRDRYSGGYHMVTIYFGHEDGMPLVLDNLSFRILPLSKRTDLELRYCFNDAGRFTIDAKNRRVKLRGTEPKFDDLKKRIAEER